MVLMRNRMVIILGLGVVTLAAGCKKKPAYKPAAATNPPEVTKTETQPARPQGNSSKATTTSSTPMGPPPSPRPAAAKKSARAVTPKPAPKKPTPTPSATTSSDTQFNKPRPTIEITPGGKTDEPLQHPEVSTEQLQAWVEEKIKTIDPSPTVTVQESIDQAKSFLQTSREATIHGDVELAHNFAVKAYVLVKDLR